MQVARGAWLQHLKNKREWWRLANGRSQTQMRSTDALKKADPREANPPIFQEKPKS